jgi:hypothetical protein
MNTPKKPLLSIADIEREVIAEAREFGRQRLEERLQELADQQGEVFPPPSTPGSKADAAKRVGKHPPKG